MPIKAPHGPIISAEPPHGASTDTQPPQGVTEPVSPHSMLGRRMASPSATSNRVPPRLQRQSSGAPGARNMYLPSSGTSISEASTSEHRGNSGPSGTGGDTSTSMGTHSSTTC
ncbi:hypothetical protein GN244_ATG20151 [Phytophthora infestans]|uniref:Uncharacterized protein n=1 Tax=Phytophthora infestans TaxID=4787 RepID=A0A833STF5_PHYIN|nr:hypothetical protein GN244_ATG20151 [Phytophthora infestans]KAF4143917.1 hypothetical protein GN958_ATG06890 [Phytophthora infestans]